MTTCRVRRIQLWEIPGVLRTTISVIGLVFAGTGLGPAPARAQVTGVTIKVDTPVVILRSNVSSRTLTTSRIVIRDSVTWARIWEEANSARSSLISLPPLPQVAFDREMVLAASMGYRGLGSGVSIPWVRDSAGVLRIRVEFRTPGPDCVVGTEVQHPLVLVRIPISYSIPAFDDRVFIHNCDSPIRFPKHILKEPPAKPKR